MGKIIDLTGQTFGFLKVLEKVECPEYLKTKHTTYYKCKCLYKNCGVELILCRNSLINKNNKNKSCGCYCLENRGPKDPEKARLTSAKKIYDHYKELEFDTFLYLTQLPCHYCGLEAIYSNCMNVFRDKKYSEFSRTNGYYYYNGLDKINPFGKYLLDNVFPCCDMCNKFKQQLSVNEFYYKISNLNKEPIINIIKIGHTKKIKDIFPYKTARENSPNEFLIPYRIRIIKADTKRKGQKLALTDYEIAEFVTSPCAYCNSPADPANLITNGIDRMDNDRYYLKDNCVPSCINCNKGKNNHTLEEFLAWIERITTFQAHKNNNSSIPIYQPSDLQTIIEAGKSI